MRADRLVALLLLLQRRGHVTAAEVAAELEVSERTARRDLEALGRAGLPVYSRQGRNGGWELAGRGRTDLSGLTEPEVRALFMVAGPSSSATPQVRAALRKLVRALPERFRDQAEAASNAVVVDLHGWERDPAPAPEPPALLDDVQHAVIAGGRARLGYRARNGTATERTIDPLGLAAKGHVWYLVAGTEAGLRTFRVDRMTSFVPTGEPVRRPAGFDLRAAWDLIVADVDELRTPVRARAFADRETVPWVRFLVGARLRIGPATPDGRVELELRGQHVRSLAAEIAGLGDRLEVVEPPELRVELARIGEELARTYG